MTNEVGRSRSEEARGKALLPIFAVVVMDTAGAGLILPLLPNYAPDFGATPLKVGFLFASFAICEFFAGPILGNASDRLGRKRLLLVSQICALAMTDFAAVGLLSISPKMSDPKER
jgi:MFS family permease